MISIKKLATVGAAAGLLFASALPALANGGGGGSELEQENKDTTVINNVDVNAKTGWNDIGGGPGGNRKITTGDADAFAQVVNYVNKNKAVLSDCKCFKKVEQENKNTNVTNTVDVDAKTGANSIGGGPGGKREIKTGGAVATGLVTNMVNKNVVIVN